MADSSRLIPCRLLDGGNSSGPYGACVDFGTSALGACHSFSSLGANGSGAADIFECGCIALVGEGPRARTALAAIGRWEIRQAIAQFALSLGSIVLGGGYLLLFALRYRKLANYPQSLAFWMYVCDMLKSVSLCVVSGLRLFSGLDMDAFTGTRTALAVLGSVATLLHGGNNKAMGAQGKTAQHFTPAWVHTSSAPCLCDAADSHPGCTCAFGLLATMLQAGLVGSVAFYLALAHNFHRSIADPFTRPSSRLASYHWACWGAVIVLSVGYLFRAEHGALVGHGYRAAFLACWFPERRGEGFVTNWQALITVSLPIVFAWLAALVFYVRSIVLLNQGASLQAIMGDVRFRQIRQGDAIVRSFFVYWAATGALYTLQWALSASPFRKIDQCNLESLELWRSFGLSGEGGDDDLGGEGWGGLDGGSHVRSGEGACSTSAALQAAFSCMLCAGGGVNALAGFWANRTEVWHMAKSAYRSVGSILRGALGATLGPLGLFRGSLGGRLDSRLDGGLGGSSGRWDDASFVFGGLVGGVQPIVCDEPEAPTYSATHAYGGEGSPQESEYRDISATLRDEVIQNTMRGIRHTTLRAAQGTGTVGTAGTWVGSEGRATGGGLGGAGARQTAPTRSTLTGDVLGRRDDGCEKPADIGVVKGVSPAEGSAPSGHAGACPPLMRATTSALCTPDNAHASMTGGADLRATRAISRAAEVASDKPGSVNGYGGSPSDMAATPTTVAAPRGAASEEHAAALTALSKELSQPQAMLPPLPYPLSRSPSLPLSSSVHSTPLPQLQPSARGDISAGTPTPLPPLLLPRSDGTRYSAARKAAAAAAKRAFGLATTLLPGKSYSGGAAPLLPAKANASVHGGAGHQHTTDCLPEEQSGRIHGHLEAHHDHSHHHRPNGVGSGLQALSGRMAGGAPKDVHPFREWAPLHDWQISHVDVVEIEPTSTSAMSTPRDDGPAAGAHGASAEGESHARRRTGRQRVVFREFAPRVFQWLRSRVYGVSASDYIHSMTGIDPAASFTGGVGEACSCNGGSLEVGSVCSAKRPAASDAAPFAVGGGQPCGMGGPSASGSSAGTTTDGLAAVLSRARHFSEARGGGFFFLSADGRYMVKSMTKAEHNALLSLLPHYCRHVRDNRRSLICRISGCYSITMYGQTKHFFVMDNLFHMCPPMHERYDLKGSWVDRHAKLNASVRKDADWPAGRRLRLQPSTKRELLRQAGRDARFLCSCRVMDYSVLLGIHNVVERRIFTGASTSASGLAEGSAGTPHASTSTPAGRLTSAPSPMARGAAMTPREMHRSSCASPSPFDTVTSEGPALSLLAEQTGPSTFTAATFEGPGLYQMGIIDVLQRWTIAKRCERLFKILFRLRCREDVRNGMSAVDPHEYARRFHLMVGTKLLGLPREEVDRDWENETRERMAVASAGFQYFDAPLPPGVPPMAYGASHL